MTRAVLLPSISLNSRGFSEGRPFHRPDVAAPLTAIVEDEVRVDRHREMHGLVVPADGSGDRSSARLSLCGVRSMGGRGLLLCCTRDGIREFPYLNLAVVGMSAAGFLSGRLSESRRRSEEDAARHYEINLGARELADDRLDRSVGQLTQLGAPCVIRRGPRAVHRAAVSPFRASQPTEKDRVPRMRVRNSRRGAALPMQFAENLAG